MGEGRDLVLVGSVKGKLKELYDYRNVLRSLVEKGLFGRYRNSFLGFAWHFAMPMVYIGLCFFINTEIRERSMENYWAFVASGILVFHMLTSSVAGGCGCFTGNAGILKKMYLPREILVISRATTSMIVMLIGYAVVIGLMAVVGILHNPVTMLLILPLIPAIYFFCIGCMLALSSLTVYVRDIQYLLGSMGIVFFVFSPLRYMADTATGVRATILWMNPFTYYLESFHSILYLGEVPDLYVYGMCFLLAFIAMVVGYLIFNRLKNGFVERL
ncbi:MAG: ABC transporter permease [Candidatus Methanomethylophilaceae archaeon]|nr:ABC transporter permease [Candidatus Methanomethylophilaceae archaeon]